MLINLHDSQTEQTADDQFHVGAEGGAPEHGNGVKGEEVVNEDVGDHAEVANATANTIAGVIGRAVAGTHVHGEDRGDTGPDDDNADGQDENGLIAEVGGEAV